MRILVIGLIVLGVAVSIRYAQGRAVHAPLSQMKRTTAAR
jgi:hypothetical protein